MAADRLQDDAHGERVGVVVIHGVGETDPGWINSYVVDRIVKDRKDISFEASSEVFSLPDAGSTETGKTFDVFVRRGRDGSGRSIAVMELFWADLSRVGSGVLSSTISTVRLFYEAPLVFGAAALRRGRPGVLGLLGWLVLFANWMLRWPITGTNVAVFACCLAVLGLRFVSGIPLLARTFGPWVQDLDILHVIVPTLIVAAGLGWWLGRQLAHRDIALADVGLSTFAFSLVLLVLVLLVPLPRGELDVAVPVFLEAASRIIMPLWAMWTFAIVAAILLLAGLALLRIVRILPGRRVALARPAAALGLSTIQGMIWKVVVSLLWVFMIGALLPGLLGRSKCLPAAMGSCAVLDDLSTNLVIVALSNTFMAAVLALTFLAVLGLRAGHRKLRRRALMRQQVLAPRLIVSRVMIVVMFALTLVNAYNYYGPQFQELLRSQPLPVLLADLTRWMQTLPFPISSWLAEQGNRQLLRDLLGLSAGAGVPALVTYLSVVTRLQNATAGMLHAARDLVDHQYTADGVLSRWLLPRGKWSSGIRHPRRARVQKRLDALMDTVVAAQGFNRVVFVAHSQGSVILLDYLRSRRDDNDLAEARRIDVVTLASPLTYLYRYYFPDYDRAFDADRLNPKLASWTNYWRIDDPIGNRIDIVRDGFVCNVALPPGGHIDYWKERAVRDKLLALVAGDPVAAVAPSGTT